MTSWIWVSHRVPLRVWNNHWQINYLPYCYKNKITLIRRAELWHLERNHLSHIVHFELCSIVKKATKYNVGIHYILHIPCHSHLFRFMKRSDCMELLLLILPLLLFTFFVWILFLLINSYSKNTTTDDNLGENINELLFHSDLNKISLNNLAQIILFKSYMNNTKNYIISDYLEKYLYIVIKMEAVRTDCELSSLSSSSSSNMKDLITDADKNVVNNHHSLVYTYRELWFSSPISINSDNSKWVNCVIKCIVNVSIAKVCEERQIHILFTSLSNYTITQKKHLKTVHINDLLKDQDL